MMAIVMVNDDHSADPRYETTKQQPNINQTTIKLLTIKQQPPNNNHQTATTTRTKATTTKNNSKLKCPSTCWPWCWPHVNNMSHHKKPCNTRSSVNIIKTRHCHSSSSCWPWCWPNDNNRTKDLSQPITEPLQGLGPGFSCMCAIVLASA